MNLMIYKSIKKIQIKNNYKKKTLINEFYGESNVKLS